MGSATPCSTRVLVSTYLHNQICSVFPHTNNVKQSSIEQELLAAEWTKNPIGTGRRETRKSFGRRAKTVGAVLVEETEQRLFRISMQEHNSMDQKQAQHLVSTFFMVTIVERNVEKPVAETR